MWWKLQFFKANLFIEDEFISNKQPILQVFFFLQFLKKLVTFTLAIWENIKPELKEKMWHQMASPNGVIFSHTSQRL